jgi:hypothetical protein
MNTCIYFSFFAFIIALQSGCSVSDTEAEAIAYRTKSRVDMSCRSVEIYREDHGYFPNAKNGLESLIEREKISSDSLIFIDGWKRPLLPVVSNSLIVGAYSVGPNGKDEGGRGDDISCRAKAL